MTGCAKRPALLCHSDWKRRTFGHDTAPQQWSSPASDTISSLMSVRVKRREKIKCFSLTTPAPAHAVFVTLSLPAHFNSQVWKLNPALVSSVPFIFTSLLVNKVMQATRFLQYAYLKRKKKCGWQTCEQKPVFISSSIISVSLPHTGLQH